MNAVGKFLKGFLATSLIDFINRVLKTIMYLYDECVLCRPLYSWLHRASMMMARDFALVSCERLGTYGTHHALKLASIPIRDIRSRGAAVETL